MKKTIIGACALILIAGGAMAGSCGSSDHAHDTDAKQIASSVAKLDIVETAIGSEDFTTLVAAVKAAGLVEALKGEGPFTVFAPTNAAFAELPQGTLEALLKDTKKLAAILTYHVVEGAVMAEQVVGLDKAATLNGQEIRFAVIDGAVTVNGATVIATDIPCSNGVIHVIDKVILPEM